MGNLLYESHKGLELRIRAGQNDPDYLSGFHFTACHTHDRWPHSTFNIAIIIEKRGELPLNGTSISVLGPDYEDLTLMSTGGMGELFRAHKRGLDVDVVVKRVKAQFRGRTDETREANILKNLRHQFLPQIYDIIYGSDGYIYTVMDYIPGCNLHEYVEQHGALPQKTCLKWLKQLCEVVAHLHQQKPPVIHCDIKPQNIMITPEEDICLIDFNTSLLYSDAEMNALGVTHGYAAPEQYHVSQEVLSRISPTLKDYWSAWSAAAAPYGKVSERTDIYGIGATAYFMLTGYDPAHSLENVIPLSRYALKITDAFRDVVERAMRLNPKERFPSARAMRSALENLGKTDRRYRSWKRRCQVTAVALGLLALGSVFSIWMGLELQDQDSDEQYRQIVAQADEQIGQQQYEESLETIGSAIAIDDDRIEAYIRASTVLYRLGRYSECIDLLSGLNFVYDEDVMTQQEFDYAQAELNYVLGSCYFQEDRYTEAVQSLELATWFDSGEPLYFRDLAVAQAMCGNLDQAQKTYAALKAMANANKEDLLLVESELAFAEGRYADALTPAQQLTQSRDSSLASRSYLLAAQCYRHLGDVRGEISILETACSVLDAASSTLHAEQLTDAYLRGGTTADYENALAVCSGLMERGAATMAVRLNMGLALQYLGRAGEALPIVEAVVADYPNNYRGYARLALLCLDQQVADYDRAREAYDQAAALYGGEGVQDSEMTYLESLIQDLPQR